MIFFKFTGQFYLINNNFPNYHIFSIYLYICIVLETENTAQDKIWDNYEEGIY